MASRKIKYEIEFDAEGAIKSLEKLGVEVDDVTEKVDSIDDGAKKSTKGMKGLGVSIKGLASATGILALVSAAVEILSEAFRNNQAVMDTVNTATTALGIAFNDFFNFIGDNVGAITGFFSDIFEDPMKHIEALGNAVKENLIERFMSLLEVYGHLGKSLQHLFEGEFTKAWESVKEAGTEAVDVVTGVDGSLEKITETVDNATDAVINYTTSTWKSAAAVTQMNKDLETLAIRQQGLKENYDLLAEQQRQIRDDETRTISDRIAANERLGKILDEQAQLEKDTINARIFALSEQQRLLGNTTERQNEILTLTNELAEVDARVAGFKSEQLTNQNSLLREQAEVMKELDAIGLDETTKRLAEAEAVYDERTRLAMLYVEDEAERARILAAIEKELQDEIQAIEDEARDKAAAAQKEQDAKALAAAKAKQEAINSISAQGFDFANNLNNLLEATGIASAEQTFKREKALGIVQAIVNTAVGVTQALKEPFGIVKSIGIAAAGAAQIAAIKNTEFSAASYAGGGASSGASAPSAASVVSAAPSFNLIGDTGVNQIADAINGQNGQPIKAYVVSDEITTQQQMDRQVRAASTFGG